MEKKSHYAKWNSSVNEAMNQQPNNESVVNSVEQPKNDVPPLPPLLVFVLCFPDEEDMGEIEQEYKVLRTPPVIDRNYFQNLGFVDGYDTLMYVSDKKAKLSRKSTYSLGRSWIEKGVTEKDKCHTSDEEAKGYLKEFVEQAKAAKVLARMSRQKKGKMVQKQVLSTSAPLCGKKKFVRKMRSLKDILESIDQGEALV